MLSMVVLLFREDISDRCKARSDDAAVQSVLNLRWKVMETITTMCCVGANAIER